MVKKKMDGFTLIELIAVLVIMAILSLIITPLVMSIIRKARISADKRSVDAYGRSIELAIAGYLLDNGSFPTSIDQLTIEYSGNEVVCSTTQLNSDSSVYLTGCTVDGRTIDYAYGTDKNASAPGGRAYEVGNEVTYNNIDYYVIADSAANESTVTLLKKTPLTATEVNNYGGVGTANNHVNMYVSSNTSAPDYQTADTGSSYAGVAYYSSSSCGYAGPGGCTTSYSSSEVKYIVDAWAADKVPSGLQEARLITLDEVTNFGYEYVSSCPTCGASWMATEDTPSWLYTTDYSYWTMTQYQESSSSVYTVSYGMDNTPVYQTNVSIRPVIVLSKSVLQ